MIAELVISVVASVSLSAPKVVYNVASDDKKVTNIEAYSVSEGKYLKRMYKISFVYNAEGEVVNKDTYQWNEKKSTYVLKDTETFDQ